MDEKFKRHVGKGTELEIDGDVFVLKPLSIEHLPDLFQAMKGLAGVAGKKEVDMTDFFKGLDDTASKAIERLIFATLKKSYPEEEDETLKEFGMKYALILFPKVMEMNSSAGSTDDQKRKLEIMEKMKK